MHCRVTRLRTECTPTMACVACVEQADEEACGAPHEIRSRQSRSVPPTAFLSQSAHFCAIICVGGEGMGWDGMG